MCIRDSVEAGDYAAQAVPGNLHRLHRGIMGQQGIEVGNVIGENVRALVPLRLAESAPVGRDDSPVALQRIDRKLKRGANIAPAVQEEERWRTGFAPDSDVMAPRAQ